MTKQEAGALGGLARRRNRPDLTGLTFERLVVLGRAKLDGRSAWDCACSCGGHCRARGSDLVRGHIRSCGCLRREALLGNNRTHGGSQTRAYESWRRAVARCADPFGKDWKNYGGRGIKVCDRWLRFESFLADMGERPPGTSIDRIDNDGNYEPGNCRWATAKEQRANQRPRRRKAA